MTFDEARDLMLKVFNDVWTPRAVAWTDVPGDPSEAIWARPVVRHAVGRQGSLADDTGQIRYERRGILWIQIFAPIGDGSTSGYAAAQEVVNAYQAAKLDVWFRNVRLEEMGNDRAGERFDVKADFEYEDVR